MTDRVNYLTVVLEENMRVDDVEALVNAIGCMRHVLAVKPNIADADAAVAKIMARAAIAEKILDVLRETP